MRPRLILCKTRWTTPLALPSPRFPPASIWKPVSTTPRSPRRRSTALTASPTGPTPATRRRFIATPGAARSTRFPSSCWKPPPRPPITCQRRATPTATVCRIGMRSSISAISHARPHSMGMETVSSSRRNTAAARTRSMAMPAKRAEFPMRTRGWFHSIGRDMPATCCAACRREL